MIRAGAALERPALSIRSGTVLIVVWDEVVVRIEAVERFPLR